MTSRKVVSNQLKGGRYGEWNSLAVIFSRAGNLAKPDNPETIWREAMQTDIEILETRENPSVLWY